MTQETPSRPIGTGLALVIEVIVKINAELHSRLRIEILMKFKLKYSRLTIITLIKRATLQVL